MQRGPANLKVMPVNQESLQGWRLQFGTIYYMLLVSRFSTASKKKPSHHFKDQPLINFDVNNRHFSRTGEAIASSL